MPFIGNKPTAVPLSGDDIQDGTIGLADLSATGTKDATTFLRGDNTFASAGGTNTPSWSATITNNQTLSDSTDTLLNFDNEIFDTDSAYDTTNKRFTVPSGKAGKYFVSVIFATGGLTNVTSQFRMRIRKNGGSFRQQYLYSGSTGTALFNYANDNGTHGFHLTAIMNLSVGDYVDVTALYDTTGNFTINSGSTNSVFSGFKIIE